MRYEPGNEPMIWLVSQGVPRSEHWNSATLRGKSPGIPTIVPRPSNFFYLLSVRERRLALIKESNENRRGKLPRHGILPLFCNILKKSSFFSNMKTFIDLLNANQWVIGLFSLLVAIIGFFSVTTRIQKISTQSQKTWDNSVNQQAQTGGIAQNAGRNIRN